MEPKEILDELKTLFVARLRFDPRRLADVTFETALPKGVDHSLGLDSLDFIELAIAVEDRFNVVLDDAEGLPEHFATFGTLCRFIADRMRSG